MISFKQPHFKQDVILMLVRWYVAYALSYRDIEELAAERGLQVDHSTINRKEGQTVDFMLSEKRDEAAARAFFIKAIGSNGLPEKVTMDKSGANKAGVNTINLGLALLCMFGGLPLQMTVRQIKYLNNIIEQDHRFVKKITNSMRGFKAFHSAESTLSGIEVHHMLRKHQHCQSSNLTIFEQFYGLAA